MNALAQWLGAAVMLFTLVSARAIGVVVVAPLAWTGAPTQVRIALVLVLSLAGFAQVPSGQVLPVTVFAALDLATEFAIGAIIGFVVRLAVAVAEIAGEVMAPAIGIGAAQMFDPGAGTQHNTLATLLRYLAILLALSAGVHRVVLGALFASYRVLPPGTSHGPAPAVATVLRLTADAFETGVRVALPVLAVLFIAQISLAFVARAAPALQIFSLGFTVTLAVGGLMMVLLLPDMARAMLVDMSQIGRKLEVLLSDMGAEP